ncbi:MAG: purine-nucleoside phosphorylase [Clostridiales Family XIII bacterium]|jgi:purine-nucleoside phosphorylase|nr:purine-nucleoside phosphorylase [Clostridiales Family XIII bacterium]
MSLHIDAKVGEIAETVLLPGDPLRAKFIADNFLEDVSQYNYTRGMLGFTGTYKGQRVSVQGTGMGCPSIGIYTNELISSYDVKNLIRVGTAGGFHENLHVGDTLLATGASYESAFVKNYELNGTFSAVADFDLLYKAYGKAHELGIDVTTGTVVTTDVFYEDNENWWKRWVKMGVLAVEMETAALYMNAARHGVRALAILTISDHFVSGELASNEDRQNSFTDMMKIALETAIS